MKKGHFKRRKPLTDERALELKYLLSLSNSKARRKGATMSVASTFHRLNMELQFGTLRPRQVGKSSNI